jgi:hypothetical protein
MFDLPNIERHHYFDNTMNTSSNSCEHWATNRGLRHTYLLPGSASVALVRVGSTLTSPEKNAQYKASTHSVNDGLECWLHAMRP